MAVFADCSATSSDVATTSNTPHSYDPILLQTYRYFVQILVDVCILYTNDPHEIQYITAARWPGFIKPVLDGYRMNVKAGEEDTEFEPPATEVLLRLTRHFKPSLSLALEQLYPRLTNAVDWARANESDVAALAKDGLVFGEAGMEDVEEEEEEIVDDDMPPSSPTRPRASKRIQDQKAALNLSSSDMKETLPLSASLPRLSQFILIAAYIASMNPVKSDLRMFGRGLDGKKRRRRANRRQMANAKPKSGPAKIPQRFLGPSPFPLERLIAILGALMEENDPIAGELNQPEDEVPADGLDFRIPGERTDYEVTRVGVYASVGSYHFSYCY